MDTNKKLIQKLKDAESKNNDNAVLSELTFSFILELEDSINRYPNRQQQRYAQDLLSEYQIQRKAERNETL